MGSKVKAEREGARCPSVGLLGSLPELGMFEDEMEEGAARLAEFFTIPFAGGPGMNEDSVSVRTAMGAAKRSAGPSVAAGSLLVNSTSPYSCGDVDRNAYPDQAAPVRSRARR